MINFLLVVAMACFGFAAICELVCIGLALADVLDEIITAYRIKTRRDK